MFEGAIKTVFYFKSFRFFHNIEKYIIYVYICEHTYFYPNGTLSVCLPTSEICLEPVTESLRHIHFIIIVESLPATGRGLLLRHLGLFSGFPSSPRKTQAAEWKFSV